jgi:hypothetical protein
MRGNRTISKSSRVHLVQKLSDSSLIIMPHQLELQIDVQGSYELGLLAPTSAAKWSGLNPKPHEQ